MESKTVIFFFALVVLAVAEEAKPTHKDTLEKTKLKRGLGGLDYGFNPYSYPNFAPSNFDTKGLSPYFLPENKIPASLDPVFKISQSDPEAIQFHLNQSPIFRYAPLPFQQNDAPLLFKPEIHSLGLPQTYQASENRHTYQPSSIPQSHQPWEFSQTFGLSAFPQNYKPSTPQHYQSLGLPQTYQSLSQQYFNSHAKEEVKPIYEDRQE
ncbi:uncharacterized protein LOC117177636 [Belonocnema kinseyi]|uniref:uncharacterized protein LOC117177636 n=1 Tax=Belonocnema kinseyi TaxID=2817044 RepID=UPI00143DECE3|nr:uncharacterized protein LOC117177636 [Belonocnema kinseyi]